MPSLRLDKVCKSFGGLNAVSDMSFDIPEGRITGLIGPNGAGKTTVVNLITGMYKLSSGSIRFGDTDISITPPNEVARMGISRTFQNIRLLAEASVLENVMIGFHRHEKASLLSGILGFPQSRRETASFRDRGHALLKRFDMERFTEHPAGSLAYGHQRRVEIMRAVAMDPMILLLDEPVAGMNDVEAGLLGEVFQSLARSGIGLLLIEHNIRFVMNQCQQIHVLDSGKIIATGTPEEVTNNPAVVTAYLGAA